METGTIHGETLAVPERVIVAPAPGTFRPMEPAGIAVELAVEAEQVIGFVEAKGHSTPVRSPFGGKLIGLLAHAGERVREGQPVAWLRCAH
ncbi:MAG: biotin/lipoyl-containing protein [Acidimicrobiales bacterium]